MSKSFKAAIILGILAVALIVLFIHWCVYKLIALVFGSYLSILAIIVAYFKLGRTAVTFFVFPGSFRYNRRSQEY